MALFGGDTALNIVLKLKDEFSSTLRKAEGGLDSFQKNLMSTEDASKRFTAGIVAAGAALGAFVYQGIKTAAQLETSRQGFITLLGSAEAADKAISRIKKDAAETPFELPGLIQANQLLTSVTKDADRSERFLLNVGKALAAMGKGQPELDRIIVNLQQIGAVGKASMLDLKQFAFAGIPIFDMLKESMKGTGQVVIDNSEKIDKNGEKLRKLNDQLKIANLRQQDFTKNTSAATKEQNKMRIRDLTNQIADLNGEMSSLNAANGMVIESEDQLEKAISDGLITFEMLEDLFNSYGEGSGKFSRAFIDQAGTFNQLFSNMMDSINIFMADFVTQTGLFDFVKRVIGGFIDWLNENGPKIIDFFKMLGSEEARRGILIVAGAITGAMLPALYALTTALIAMSLPLIPWLLLGAAVALMLYNLNEIVKIFSTDSAAVIDGLKLYWQDYANFINGVVNQIVDSFKRFWGAMTEMAQVGAFVMASVAKAWVSIWITAVNTIIRALNTIKFSIPSWVPKVGGKSFGISIPLVETPDLEMPRFEHGGIIPGPQGMPVPVIAHGQERIIPSSGSRSVGGGSSYTVIIQNPVVRSQADVNEMRKQMEAAFRDVTRGHKLSTI